MKRNLCLLLLALLSLNTFATSTENNKYYTNLKNGCKIMTGLADLSMHHRQQGSSFKKASSAITLEKYLEKNSNIGSKKEKFKMGKKLEKTYLNILRDAYKIEIKSNQMGKQESIEKYANKFYKTCLKLKKRF